METKLAVVNTGKQFLVQSVETGVQFAVALLYDCSLRKYRTRTKIQVSEEDKTNCSYVGGAIFAAVQQPTLPARHYSLGGTL